jgi:CHAT domain-containing protein/tetratricopeptide (TPR) repeat protein
MSQNLNNVSRGIFSALWLSFFLSVSFAQATTSPNQQNTQTLPTFAAQERELKGGETHAYRVALTSGQFFYALVEQKGIDVSVALFAPDGQEIGEADSPNDQWGTEPVLLVAGKSGDYRIEVRSPNSKVPPGRYEIRIVQLRESTAEDRRLVQAQRLSEEAEKTGSQQNAAAKRESIEKYLQAAQLFADSGEPLRQALTLRSMIVRFAQLGDFRNLLKYSKEALALAQRVQDRRLESGVETFVGGASSALGDVKEALAHYERAVVLARETGVSEASALNNIGAIYSEASDQQKALEYFLRALPLYKPLGNQFSEAITLNNIGNAYNKLGEPQKALDYLQQAVPMFQAVGAKGPLSFTLSNIGIAYRGLGDYEKALSYFNQAQTIQQQTGNKVQEAETLDQLGVLYSQQNQLQKALEYHQQALQLLHATGNVRREAVSLSNLGHVYTALGRLDEGMDHFNQALAVFRRIGDLNNIANALEGRARVQQQRGNLTEARKDIEESLSLIETVRAQTGSQQHRASYLASREKAYEFFIDLLMQQGHDAEALQASERGRARSLTEMLNESHVDILQGVDPTLVQKERDIRRSLNAKAQRQIQLTAQQGKKEEIDTLNKEISALEDDYQQVQSAIRNASPAYAALTQPQPLDLKGIQQQLDPDTVLLEYSLGQKRSYLFLVTQNSLTTYELPPAEQIQKLAQQVYESVSARSAGAEFRKSAAELGQMILSPALAELGTKRLAVVADGPLQYVPFAALSAGKEYRPLVVDHEMVSIPSASALAVQRQSLANRKPAPKGLAVLADPVFSIGDARFKGNTRAKEASSTNDTRIIEHTSGGPAGQLAIRRLPFTRQEADQIMSVAPTGANFKALDFRASRSVATSGELSQYRYVHFATHGYLDTARSGLSAIVLSMIDEQGNPQDGFLRTHDIYNLKLPAELVVLSACETGLGKDVKGEGIEGLTRGFMYAGARRVVVSLWNVNDRATAALMQRLYVGMLKSNKTPAAALRAAQIELLRTRQWQSPYYWAAFVMQGEWN